MKKLLLIVLLIGSVLIAKDLTPTKIYKADGSVISMAIDIKNNRLYGGTDQGVINIFDINSTQIIDSVKLPKILDFMGDSAVTKIYSMDVIDNKLLFVTEAEKGYRKVYIYKDKKLTKIVSKDEKLIIQRVAFVDKDRVLFGLLGSELILFDLKSNKKIYSKSISQSKFSDFALNEDRTKVVIADESGVIPLLDIKTGKIIKKFKGENVDNIFQIDYKNGTIISAGQDRRCSIYTDDDITSYYIEGRFLLYSAGLSPDASIAGFAFNEDNEIQVFNTDTKEKLHKLTGHPTTLTNIIFVNNKELFSSSEDENILYWKLP